MLKLAKTLAIGLIAVAGVAGATSEAGATTSFFGSGYVLNNVYISNGGLFNWNGSATQGAVLTTAGPYLIGYTQQPNSGTPATYISSAHLVPPGPVGGCTSAIGWYNGTTSQNAVCY